MRNDILFLITVLAGSSSLAQKITIGQVGGYEFAVGKNGGSNQVFNFNQNMLFFQPIALTHWFNNKLGIQAVGQVGIYTKDVKPDNVKLPVASGTDVYLYTSQANLSKGQEAIKVRIGLVYNIERNKWSFKTKLLAGVMKIEADQTTLILKEKNTNIYFSDRYRPNGSSSGPLSLFLISGGMNISRALTSRFSLTADALYSHARNTFSVSRTLTNLYIDQVSEQTFKEKIRLNSIALGIGFAIKVGKVKAKENLL